jgi:DNA-binding XRE family transcriptional regulator
MDVKDLQYGETARIARKIRKKIGMTQGALAKSLGLSIRAIQSYEQGWREVPTHVMVQLLVLAAAFYSGGERKPCWEMLNCSAEDMQKCPCPKTDGMLCWLVTGRQSVPCKNGFTDDLTACMQCPVIKQILDD